MWTSLHHFFSSRVFTPYHFLRAKSGRGSARQLGGFTLVELLVVVLMITLITMMLLLRQSKFNSSTLLRSLAYSVALSVRQAQVYGTSVFGTTTAQSLCIGGSYALGTCYSAGYGLYFDTASPGQYSLFADLNNNGSYDSGEAVQTFKFGKGYQISEICALDESLGKRYCSGADNDSGLITQLNIVFKRPNPDAQFSALNAGTPVAGNFASAYIQVKNTASSDATRSVYVNTTGQIIVQTVGKTPASMGGTTWP